MASFRIFPRSDRIKSAVYLEHEVFLSIFYESLIAHRVIPALYD